MRALKAMEKVFRGERNKHLQGGGGKEITRDHDDKHFAQQNI